MHLCELDVFPQHFPLPAPRPCLCPRNFQLALLKAVVDFTLEKLKIENWRAVHLKGRPCRPGYYPPAVSTDVASLHTLLHHNPDCSSKTAASLLLLLRSRSCLQSFIPPAHPWGQEISESFYAVSTSSFIDKVLWGSTYPGRLESDTAEPPLRAILGTGGNGNIPETKPQGLWTYCVDMILFLRNSHFQTKFLIFHAIVKGKKNCLNCI